MFYVVEISFQNGTEIHNIEEIETFRMALAEYHYFLTNGIRNLENTYVNCFILDNEGNMANKPTVYNTTKNEEDEFIEPFAYLVIKQHTKNNQSNISLEYKSYDELYPYYFTVLAADLQDEAVTSHFATIVGSTEGLMEHHAFTK